MMRTSKVTALTMHSDAVRYGAICKKSFGASAVFLTPEQLSVVQHKHSQMLNMQAIGSPENWQQIHDFCCAVNAGCISGDLKDNPGLWDPKDHFRPDHAAPLRTKPYFSAVVSATADEAANAVVVEVQRSIEVLGKRLYTLDPSTEAYRALDAQRRSLFAEATAKIAQFDAVIDGEKGKHMGALATAAQASFAGNPAAAAAAVIAAVQNSTNSEDFDALTIGRAGRETLMRTVKVQMEKVI